MATIDRNGVRLYYEVHGHGPPLILTHGFSSTSQMWREQVEALSRHHRLILWDMRGHGQSDYPDDPDAYSEAHTVGDIAALLDEVGAERAVVGGLSLGGYMSLAFYRAYPARVRALLIIDTGPGFKKDEARDAWNKRAQDTAERFEREGLSGLQASSRERSSVTHRDATGLAHAARGMLTQRDAAVIASLPEIAVPSLIVVGADDTPFLAASDYMAAKIPGAKKSVIPAAGHAVNIDQPAGFINAVLPFLDALPRDEPMDQPATTANRTGPVMMRLLTFAALLIGFPFALEGRADAQQVPPGGNPLFIESLSNLTPLAFGMKVDETSRALAQPLRYVSGRPGNEIYLAFRNLGGSGLITHHDRLYLQFRGGRLTAWKEDYGQNWMWR